MPLYIKDDATAALVAERPPRVNWRTRRFWTNYPGICDHLCGRVPSVGVNANWLRTRLPCTEGAVIPRP